MLIILCCPKPLSDDEFLKIQTNTILSLKQLDIKKKIIVVGDDDQKSNQKFCDEHDIIHEPNVEVNDYGTPLVSSILSIGVKHSQQDDSIMYINSDIILCSNFAKTYQDCNQFMKENKKYLLIGQRTDIDDLPIIDYNNEKWEEKILELVHKDGKLHDDCGIDYFIFSPTTYDLQNMYDFAIGRYHWDRWLVGKCIDEGIPTVDITKGVLAIHQNGSYYQFNTKTDPPTMFKTKEVQHNLAYQPNYGRNIGHSQLYFVNGEIKQR